ncbi:unnamed protein product [Caenorhabditis auriculariae]|uniref:rhomboid protease n=1 Tax=Caenorhabditis auriculariae TaxID=2777116 RepID=A0A8S1H3W8_9PELO|nr:unnamed protein product [Caenorhabditis auriculariae]
MPRMGPRVCFRYFTQSFSIKTRFTREGIRFRLKTQKKNDQNVRYNVNSWIDQNDHIKIRPVSDLLKCFGFTFLTATVAFNLAIYVDWEKTKKATRNYISGLRRSPQGESLWDRVTPASKAAFTLIGLNCAVFLLWKVRSWHPFMWRYFTNSFSSKSLCLPMLTSVFSHSSAVHLAFNMYATYSFFDLLIQHLLGVEQFWAFYLTAGVVSSLASLSQKAVTRNPVRALGASGAILAMVSYFCMRYPNSELSLLLVPGLKFSAESALWAILLFDTAGLIFRFRVFDHAAHLGGALFGVFYALYGEEFIWKMYGDILRKNI